jgi:hypothetical protein
MRSWRWLAAALGIALVALGAAASSASAFLGESTVLNPAKTDLTGPAKTIIERPTFLPDTVTEAGASSGVGEASEAAAVFEGAGVLPALGASVLGFGAGVGVGSAICHVLGIEGCWLFTSTEAKKASVVAGTVFEKGTWEFKVNSPDVTLTSAKKYAWWWFFNNGLWSVPLNGYTGGEYCKNRYVVPPNMSRAVQSTDGQVECGSGHFYYGAEGAAMAGRSISYSKTNGGFPEVSYTAPSKWSENMAAQLKGQEGTPAARVGQKVASELESSVHDPYATYVTVPSCSGEAWIKCKADLEELKLVPERHELTWETADIELAPDTVIELQPAPATEVKTGTKVVVTTNPDEAGMPLVVPQPESGEVYAHYVARLNPGLLPERHDLEAAFVNPADGPNAVEKVEPVPETRFDPATEHTVRVTTNPADAPAPIAAWSPPAIPALDMGPLSGLSPCGVFPFGLFCWMGEAFGQFNTTGVCPHVAVPVGYSSDFELSLCGETSETVMGYVRPALLLAFIIGCGIMFARGTKAVGGGD